MMMGELVRMSLGDLLNVSPEDVDSGLRIFMEYEESEVCLLHEVRYIGVESYGRERVCTGQRSSSSAPAMFDGDEHYMNAQSIV